MRHIFVYFFTRPFMITTTVALWQKETQSRNWTHSSEGTDTTDATKCNSHNYFHIFNRPETSFSELANIEGRSVWSMHSRFSHGNRKDFGLQCTVRQWVRRQFFLSCLTPPHVILQAVLDAKRRRVNVLRLGESVSIVLCRIAKQHPSEETQIESDRRPFKC